MPDHDERDTARIEGSDLVSDDNSSGTARPTRRSGDGPYRDVRDVLLAKRRRVGEELARAEHAAARAEALRRELAYVDGSLRASAAPLLARVKVGTPCRERWDDMSGNDVVRHCKRCQKDVYDLAGMTTAEAEALLGRDGERPCVRLRRRRDGRVVTADCPPAPLLSRVGTHVAVALSAAGVALAVAPNDVEVTTPACAVSTPAWERPADERRVLGGNVFDELGDVIGEVRMGAPAPVHAEPRHGMFVLDEGSLRTAWPRTTRFIPVATPEGEPPKVAVYGIGPASALHRMGLRNGDALLRLGGLPVDGPDAAFEAFARLSKDRLLWITFEREGALREHLVRLE